MGSTHTGLYFEAHLYSNQDMGALDRGDIFVENAQITRIRRYGDRSKKLFMQAQEYGPVQVRIPRGVLDVGDGQNDVSNTVNLTIVRPRAPSSRASFFVTSLGGEDGGNFGGLSGADQRCQTLAEAAGYPERTYRAYLSADAVGGAESVHARNRIGSGPWYNHDGDQVAADVDGLHERGIAPELMIHENGVHLGGIRADHDIVTGSTPDGRVSQGRTCRGWTSNASGDSHRLGHADWEGNDPYVTSTQNWNSTHNSRCDAVSMRRNLGIGKIYCFGVD